MKEVDKRNNKINNKVLFVLLFFGLVLFSACSDISKSENGQELENNLISPQELKQMLDSKDFTLIDVHIPEQKHIPGTDMMIPFNQIEANLDKLPKDKNAKIVIYCRSGSMSAKAVQTLRDLGYTNVYDLEGGINAWKAQGFDVDENLKFSS